MPNADRPIRKERDGREVIDGTKIVGAIVLRVRFASRDFEWSMEADEIDGMPPDTLASYAYEAAKEQIGSCSIELLAEVSRG